MRTETILKSIYLVKNKQQTEEIDEMYSFHFLPFRIQKFYVNFGSWRMNGFVTETGRKKKKLMKVNGLPCKAHFSALIGNAQSIQCLYSQL